MTITETERKALEWAHKHYPDAHPNRHKTLVNCVNYLVGQPVGWHGPSIREHYLYWLFNDSVWYAPTDNYLTPLSGVPRPGEWDLEKAIALCEPICYGALPEIALTIADLEFCYDEDPADELVLKQMGYYLK